MIYLDTSVALAHLLAEDREPPASLWAEELVSSRLLEYELATRLNALEAAADTRSAARALMTRVAMVELVGPVLEDATGVRASSVRTLDALHLAAASFLRDQGVDVTVASYDQRMCRAAATRGFALFELGA